MERTVTRAPQHDAAATIMQLAVLLEAGVAPARAWRHLADAGDATAAEVVSAHAQGMPLADAIATAGTAPDAARASERRRPWRRPVRRPLIRQRWLEAAAAWRVASTVGAPLASSLRSLAVALRDAQDTADEVRVALAEPAATARLMSWLPLVAVVLGIALGFDTLGVLVTHPLGIACLIGGGVLVVVAARWTRALGRTAAAEGDVPGMTEELLAIALSGGVAIDRARAVVAGAGGGGSDAEPRPTGSDTEALLDLSRTAGVPAVELLRAAAALARHRARIDGRLRAARLSARLLLPLGVCTLPAFLLLGVAPMLLSVMSTMTITL